MHEVTIEKLVYGGQGLGTLPDGRKIFVWNALPGEVVRVRSTKQKRTYLEGIAEEIVKATSERIEPLETNYLATSPWQILDFAAENKYKQAIAHELFTREHIKLSPNFQFVPAASVSGRAAHARIHSEPGAIGVPLKPVSRGKVRNPEGVSHYRNKMEYSFYGDDDGLHLALFGRGSHGKQIVEGSTLALPAVDKAANQVLMQLQKLSVRAGDLKTIIVRSSQIGAVIVALFVKVRNFPKLSLPKGIQGLQVYYSNPKSPASLPTKLLQNLGQPDLSDTILGQSFSYGVNSFFQVNVPMYERALLEIKNHVSEPEVVDMYAGVGSIGLSLDVKQVDLVELDQASAAMARNNAKKSHVKATVIETAAEQALELITAEKPVIFDPPRSGLHPKIVDRLLEVKPPKIIYLSCNPATQARDIKWLSAVYDINFFEAYNFFPHTPHIESLAVLRLRI